MGIAIFCTSRASEISFNLEERLREYFYGVIGTYIWLTPFNLDLIQGINNSELEETSAISSSPSNVSIEQRVWNPSRAPVRFSYILSCTTKSDVR